MTVSWQLGITLLCVFAAAVYLVRRVVRLFAGHSGGCGSGGGSGACGSCPTARDGHAVSQPGTTATVELLEDFRDPAR